MKDIRSYNGVHNLRVDKACVGGVCQYAYRVQFRSTDVIDLLHISQRQVVYYGPNDTYYDTYYANTSYVDGDAMFLGGIDMNYPNMDPYDPQNFMCTKFLQPTQSFYDLDCIYPYMMYFGSYFLGYVDFHCAYFVMCGNPVLPIYSNQTIQFSRPT